MEAHFGADLLNKAELSDGAVLLEVFQGIRTNYHRKLKQMKDSTPTLPGGNGLDDPVNNLQDGSQGSVSSYGSDGGEKKRRGRPKKSYDDWYLWKQSNFYNISVNLEFCIFSNFVDAKNTSLKLYENDYIITRKF